MTWTHRDRLLAALNREEADRIAIDFAGTMCTTITVPGYDRLKEHLGIEHETVVMSKTDRLAAPDPWVLERFDVDTRCLAFGVDGKELDEHNVLDEWGVTWRQAPDQHYMPVDGPFEGKPPDIADLDSYEWFDPNALSYFDGLKERAEALRRESDRAIVLSLGAGPVCLGQWLRGFGDWLKDLRRAPEYAARLMDLITDQWVRVAEEALNIAGPNVDAVILDDDMSSQEGPMFSPEVYRELVKPRHKRMVDTVKACGEAKIMFHSCGAIQPLIDDLIEIGSDAINPVQVNAKDMEPEKLKDEVGDRVAFWGGIDTQKLLPFGTADEVRAETRRIIEVLGKGGGYVLNSVHNIQSEVPPENVVAMFETARNHRYGGARA